MDILVNPKYSRLVEVKVAVGECSLDLGLLNTEEARALAREFAMAACELLEAVDD